MSFIPHLILAGLMGIHSKIITVSQVSVKTGGSISIPCLYDQYYGNNMKYLCQGYYWLFCSIVVKTNQPNGSGRFSISDDTNQRIFIVTINNITHKDRYYWCALKGFAQSRFQLSVTTGLSNLYVGQQKSTAFEGGSVTVMCYYKYQGDTKWCRLGSSCVTDQSGSIDGTTVTINASVSNVFTVTMSELRVESSGWYWCAKGDLQMPVHVTVNELPSTTMTTNTRTLSTTHQHSSLPTSVEPSTAQPTNSTITGAAGESLQDEYKRTTKVTIVITTLVLLLLIVLAAFFGWRMIRRNKTKPEASDITAEQTPKDSVTYSTIVIRDGAKQMTKPEDGGVIYCTVMRRF